MKDSLAVLKIFGVIVLGFLAWLKLIELLYPYLTHAAPNLDYWDLVAALSTALAAIGIFTAGYYSYRELSELSRNSYIEIIDRLFAELMSDDNIAARRWIYNHLSENPPDVGELIKSLDDEGHQHIKSTLNSLDRVAFLLQPGLHDEQRILEWVNPMVYKAWTRLKAYILYERDRRNEPDYYKNAEILGERCVEWRNKHYPETEPKIVENAI